MCQKLPILSLGFPMSPIFSLRPAVMSRQISNVGTKNYQFDAIHNEPSDEGVSAAGAVGAGAGPAAGSADQASGSFRAGRAAYFDRSLPPLGPRIRGRSTCE